MKLTSHQVCFSCLVGGVGYTGGMTGHGMGTNVLMASIETIEYDECVFQLCLYRVDFLCLDL